MNQREESSRDDDEAPGARGSPLSSAEARDLGAFAFELARGLTRDAKLAEEVRQEVLLKCLSAWKNCAMPDNARARRAYVAVAVRSVWCDHLRALPRRRLHQPLSGALLERLCDSATRWPCWIRGKLDRGKRLARLNAAERVLVDAVQAGLRSAELAQLLSVSKETLNRRLSQLCRKLAASSHGELEGRVP